MHTGVKCAELEVTIDRVSSRTPWIQNRIEKAGAEKRGGIVNNIASAESAEEILRWATNIELPREKLQDILG